MRLATNRVLVSKVEEEKKDGFQVVTVEDNFTYKGKVKIGNDIYKEGDIVLFAKYSPHTHDVEHEGSKMKIIRADDILAIL